MKTRRQLLAALAAAPLAMLPRGVAAQAAPRIERAQLEQMFANLRARTNWNVDGPLLWGYFFFDASEQKLGRAAEALAEQGYKVVGIEQPPDTLLYRLHVERVEVHTPDSLHARNQALYALAEKFKLQSYDGMDVGPAP